jgi:hypothetical protein
MKTEVVNLSKEAFDVYIGRPSPRRPEGPWGNPFIIGVHGTRAQVIQKFGWALRNSDKPEFVWMRQHIAELKGKRLGCFCAPLPCHGDELAKMADAV